MNKKYPFRYVPSEVGYVSIATAQCGVGNEKKQNSFGSMLFTS